jgi:hypothetical protein
MGMTGLEDTKRQWSIPLDLKRLIGQTSAELLEITTPMVQRVCIKMGDGQIPYGSHDDNGPSPIVSKRTDGQMERGGL